MTLNKKQKIENERFENFRYTLIKQIFQIKELKKSSKQSQFWQEGEEDFIEWVQAEANGQTYYWNIFTQETEWEAPSLFYTTEEYTTNYETISQKINDLLKRAETQVEDEQTSASPEIAQPPVEEVQEK